MSGTSPHGHPKGKADATGAWIRNNSAMALTKTALKAVPETDRYDGRIVLVDADKSAWIFDESSTAADASENLVLTPAAGTGRWLRIDKNIALKLPIGFATADAAVLFTVPAGFRLAIERVWWEITADWTGGSSSAIGASSSQAPHETKGDLLGGAAGNVAAALVASAVQVGGTIGASFGSNGIVVLEAAATIRHDRITSAFTAGAGFVHALARVVG